MKDGLKEYLPLLSRSEIFRGIEGAKLSGMLRSMDARVAEYEKDETIYRIGDMVREAAIVLEGTVMVEDIDAEGGSTSVSIRQPGDEFGAHLVISGSRRSPMRLYAATRCKLIHFDVTRPLSAARLEGEDRLFVDNLLHSLAKDCMGLYQRVHIFGKKRIRSRIRVYLMSLEARDGEVVLPMNRTALAEWLGVDRAALARELGRMRKDGLIDVDKRRVRLLDKDFFQPGGSVSAAEKG
ncbi:MAG: Crp/Fnr family transcriptional regulator [Clostridia bacterium]|nr:Crp/Fnr family transcriptional regulator [Clostridia bacterium]